MKQLSLVLLATMLSVAMCDYQLRVRVYSYSNPESRCAECTTLLNSVPSCCDSVFNTGICTGEDLCDTFFGYCFRQGGICTDKVYTKYASENTDVIQNVGNTILGSPNPLLLSGNIWMGPQQFYLESMDRDSPTLSQLVETFAVNIDIEGGQRLEPQVYQGTFGLAEIELSFEVVCTDNYSLPDCTPCQPGSSPQCINRQEATAANEVLDPPGAVATPTVQPTNTTESPEEETEPSDTKIFRDTAIALGTVSLVAFLSILVLLVALLIKKKRKGRCAPPNEEVAEPTTTERPQVLPERIQTSSNLAYTVVNNPGGLPSSTTLMLSTTVHFAGHTMEDYEYDYIETTS